MVSSMRPAASMHLWQVGPVRFHVHGVAPPPDWRFDDACAAAVDVVVHVTNEQPQPAPWGMGPIASRVDALGTLHMHRPGGFEATLDHAGRVAHYRGTVDVGVSRICPVFETFLRAATAGVLSRQGGALLHASSAIVRSADGDAAAFVFAGLSGAGKTTLVEGLGDGAFLSDDQSLLTHEADGFNAWGSPFAGMAARRIGPIRAPLRALCVLASDRGDSTAVTRLDANQAVRALMRHVCSFERTAAEAERALAFAHTIAREVSVFSVRRHLDTSLLDLVHLLQRNATTQKAA